MTEELMKELRKLIMAGVGAISATGEKSSELYNSLSQKGEEVFEHGKVLNEELKHTIKQTIKQTVKDNVTVQVSPESVDSFVDHMHHLSDEDLAKLKDKLAEVEAAKENGDTEDAPVEEVTETVTEDVDSTPVDVKDEALEAQVKATADENAKKIVDAVTDTLDVAAKADETLSNEEKTQE